MPSRIWLRRIARAWALWLATTVAALGQNPSFAVLYTFGASGDGVGPSSGIIFDKQGNAYGETLGGGPNNTGMVYELSPQKDGTWSETVLYSFGPNGSGDPVNPDGGLAMDAAGNLYGVTQLGGANGYGTAFELAPGASGWTETNLHDFCTPPDDADGCEPTLGPILDSVGNLYGTTPNGGSTGSGTVYELSSGPSGWTETVLYTFCSQPNCTDGSGPGQLVRDSAGNLYGAASGGGSSFGWCPLGCGVVFALRPQPGGQWQQQVLYSFQGSNDGESPTGVALHGGALYGITADGGGSKLCTVGCGTVFELAADKNGGPPVETILHRFGPSAGGTIPFDAPAFGPSGNAFGVTGFGGTVCGVCGLVFEMSPGGNGKPPVYQVVYEFNGQDGTIPQYVSVRGGNVFGTTLGGGAPYYGGVVFEISTAPNAAD